MQLRFGRDDQRGFTLVETLSALMVFSIVTLGIVPLMASSLRGSALSRTITVSKNLAVQAMERARGLPYHVKLAAQPGDVDLLDFYYPRPPNATTAAGPVYRTTCTRGATNPACPRDLPDGYTLVFDVRFIDTKGATVPTPTSYNSDSSTADTPPSLFVDFTITSRWIAGGRAREFSLRSLIADRKFSGLKVSAIARITYAIQVLTSYRTSTVTRNLGAIAGVSESRIETRRESVADQTVRSGSLSLVNAFDGTDIVDPVNGAASIAHAPPDTDPPSVTGAPGVITHTAPLSGTVAGIDTTTAGVGVPTEADVKVVANETQLPSAQGGFSYLGGADTRDFWVDKPEANKDFRALWHFMDDSIMVSLPSSASAAASGYTTTRTTALPGGGVAANAHVEIPEVRLFPTDFAPLGIVRIQNFRADVSCNSSGGTGAQAAVASWSATLSYWVDPNDRKPGNGAYVTEALSNASPQDLLVLTKTLNPLVYEDRTTRQNVVDNSSPDDVFLFPVTHRHIDPTGAVVVHNHSGYLSDWRSRINPLTTSQEAFGRVTSANVEGAISIDTSPVPVADPNTFAATPMTISLGNLSCDAVDFR